MLSDNPTEIEIKYFQQNKKQPDALAHTHTKYTNEPTIWKMSFIRVAVVYSNKP